MNRKDFNEKYLLGKKVMIKGKHPWSGEKGVIVRIETATIINKPMIVVKLDNGVECAIFNGSKLKLI